MRIQPFDRDVEGPVRSARAATVSQGQPCVGVQFFWNVEGLGDARCLRTGNGQRLARAEHATVEGGDFPVFQRRGPDGHLIDHSLKVGAPRTVDPHAVALNLVDCSCGLLVGVDEHAIEVLAHFTGIKDRDKVHPALCFNGTKSMGLVVVQTPFTAKRSVLEGSVGSRVVGHRKDGGIIWQRGAVGPHPLANCEVSVPIVNVNVEVVVGAIKPEATPVHTGAPIGGAHAVGGQVRVTCTVQDRAA